MIRVLSIIHYPIFGGPHNRNSKVVPVLEEEGVETVVLLPDDPGNAAERLRDAGLDVVTAPLARLRAKLNPAYHIGLVIRFWGDVRRIRRIIRERNIDVVQINGLVNPQGAVAARLEGAKVVWQLLDTFSPTLLRRLLMPIVSRLSDVVMCTGRQVAEAHPGATALGNRLVLFYPPVDLDQFERSREQRKRARRKLDISADTFVVGNVGNINLQKGHRTFIRAAARLKKDVPDVRFIILGAQHDNHRAYVQSLLAEAASLGLETGADLIVLDPGTRVSELEPAFDIFWMTSEPNSEGVPTVVEEAMALSLPVVATRVGSIDEITLEGSTGFVVPPYDIEGLVERTTRLFSDSAVRSSMGRAGRDFATENFGTNHCAEKHLYAYKLAMGGSSKL